MQPEDEKAAQAQADQAARRLTTVQAFGCCGCGLLILLSFVGLGLTWRHAARRFTSDPVRVEQVLVEVLPSAVPAGYRGLLAAAPPNEPQRLAVLVPTRHEAEGLRVDLPLVLTVWRFRPEVTAEARRDEVLRWWEDMIIKRLNAAPVEASREVVTYTVRGAPAEASVRTLEVRDLRLRQVLLLVPREAGGAETVAVSALGLEADFDEAALAGYLSSVR